MRSPQARHVRKNASPALRITIPDSGVSVLHHRGGEDSSRRRDLQRLLSRLPVRNVRICGLSEVSVVSTRMAEVDPPDNRYLRGGGAGDGGAKRHRLPFTAAPAAPRASWVPSGRWQQRAVQPSVAAV